MTRHIPDVVLERYRLNELPERSARTVEEMMAADPGVRERLEALAASDAEIQRQYPSSTVRARRSRRRRAGWSSAS